MPILVYFYSRSVSTSLPASPSYSQSLIEPKSRSLRIQPVCQENLMDKIELLFMHQLIGFWVGFFCILQLSTWTASAFMDLISSTFNFESHLFISKTVFLGTSNKKPRERTCNIQIWFFLFDISGEKITTPLNPSFSPKIIS